MKRLMMIDGQNLFFRNFVMNPTIHPSGQPYGACFGFLQSLQKLIREMKPDDVFIAWDGGSDKRKEENPNYKANRKETKQLHLNRKISLLTPEEERENRHWQWAQLTQGYLNLMPIRQFWINEVEADDILAYLVQLSQFKDDLKVIVSNDKDFLQLADTKIVLYSPIKNKFYNKKNVINEFSISPTNFALARAMVGDPSDNLPGIPRVGMKSVAKRLPILKENKKVSLDELVDYCKAQEKKLALFDKIIEHKELIQNNYRLMELYKTRLMKKEKEEVDNTLENFIYEFKQTDITLNLQRDEIDVSRFTTLFAYFRGMILDKSK